MNVVSSEPVAADRENASALSREAFDEPPLPDAPISTPGERTKLLARMPQTTPARPTFAATMPLITTPAFSGPLDLLLHLIRANEVDIYDIPIAVITTQYLDYMELLEAFDLAVAGEYVVIAATLIEIKSRLLLPLPPPPEGEDEPEDPRAELVAKLLEYQQVQETLDTFRAWEADRSRIYFRGALENTDDYILPVPEGEATARQLYQALHRLLSEAGVDDKPVTAVTPRRRLSLRLKMAEIARKIAASAPDGLPFEALFILPCSRYEIVLTFLALLELLRFGRALAAQNTLHDTIWLKPMAEVLEAADVLEADATALSRAKTKTALQTERNAASRAGLEIAGPEAAAETREIAGPT